MGYAPLKSLTEARAELKKLSSIWSKESLLNTRMLLYACERLDGMAELLRTTRRPKQKRKLTAYNKFFTANVKKGMSIQDIGAAWRSREK